MGALALPAAAQADPFELLEDRSWRLAKAVEAVSKRRDVRRRRAQLVLLLLELRCPPRGRPRRRWYVPGAVARVGLRGIRRAWRGYWGEDPWSEKTIGKHLGMLEAAGILVRAPGDWLPIPRNPEHPERRPTYPQTYHLLDSDAEAEWWAAVGQQILHEDPRLRYNPDRWRMILGNWREQASRGAPPLAQRTFEWAESPAHGSISESEGPRVGDGPGACSEPAAPAAVPSNRKDRPHNRRDNITGDKPPSFRGIRLGVAESWDRLREVVHRPGVEAPEILNTFEQLGIRIRGPGRLRLQRNLRRLRAAAAMVALAIRRGDRLRNPAGWVVRAFERAPESEVDAALARTVDRSWRGHRRGDIVNARELLEAVSTAGHGPFLPSGGPPSGFRSRS